jgi:hemolysin activation/secretion protein
MFVGAGARLTHSAGDNPQGLRLLTDIRAEGAGGDAQFGRAAADFTLSRGLGRRLAAAVTVAGGTSIGDLPPQRRWYLGGTETVRGQRPDTARGGNAFWLTRVELGTGQAARRQVIFGDLGWAGDRTRLAEIGRPMSGVGVGWSFLDGVIRFDVSKGLYPAKAVRLDAYFDARF